MTISPRELMVVLILAGVGLFAFGCVAVLIRAIQVFLRVQRIVPPVTEEQLLAGQRASENLARCGHLAQAHLARITSALAQSQASLAALRILPALRALSVGAKAVRALFAAEIR